MQLVYSNDLIYSYSSHRACLFRGKLYVSAIITLGKNVVPYIITISWTRASQRAGPLHGELYSLAIMTPCAYVVPYIIMMSCTRYTHRACPLVINHMHRQ